MISWELAAQHVRHWQEHGEYLKAEALLELLLAALPDGERGVYQAIKASPWITTADLSRKMGIANNHAWVTCQRLAGMQLVYCKQAHNLIKQWHVK